MIKSIEKIANPFVAMAMGVVIGFLLMPAMAGVIERLEEARCPGVQKVQMGGIGDWGRFDACPPKLK